MTIKNTDSINILQEKVRVRVEREVDEIIKNCKGLLEKAVKKEVDKKRLNEEEKKLYRRFLQIKILSNFYEKWLKINSAKAIMKIYPVTRKLRSIKT